MKFSLLTIGALASANAAVISGNQSTGRAKAGKSSKEAKASKCVSSTLEPSLSPSETASMLPSLEPSLSPSETASMLPSLEPSLSPSETASMLPSLEPSLSPSETASMLPSLEPSLSPSETASMLPSLEPSLSPSASPTPEVECGSTIAIPTVLRVDLSCNCNDESAITVAGQGVVLDLNGHTVECSTESNQPILVEGKANAVIGPGTGKV
jgi:hypothetical protein